MDILLTHGYFLYEDPHELKVMKPYPPLGILYNSAYLKRAGYHVGVFDTTFSRMTEFEAYLERERPPVVGIYTNLMTKFNVLKMIGACKRSGASVILGGPEPANYAAEYLERGADVIVVGEGEATLEELLPRLAKDGPHKLDGILGIVYRREDGSIDRALPRPQIANLDSLPDPDREAIDIDRYVQTWRTHHGLGSASLICARGCPYHCEWCSHAVYGHTHRRRSPQRAADEVEFLLARYKPDQLWYADDVFTIKHSWFFAYADELKRRGIRIPFECISRADRLNEQVIDRLAELGCYRLWIGSESGSQNVLDEMRREVKVEQVQAMTHALKRRGIQTGMFIMLGYEGEEVIDLAATVDHLKKSTPDLFLTTVAYPIKGTAYYQKVEERVLAHADWDRRTDRQLTVTGRHSMRFYSYATRWMVNSVALHRERNNGANVARLAKAAANVALGRLGMMLTASEREA
ncbi:MAG TPA: radical SAM protein [Anaerolineae bacterium]|nr:radical SAM protein [Anaerolineae bacterium]